MSKSVVPPLVSVITPCWNAEAFLGETYDSLRRQTYSNWEWLVADDGSTDRSLEILRALADKDERVKPIAAARRGQPAAMRNIALREAAGELIAFLDADDRFEADKLRSQIEFLDKHPGVEVTYTFAQEFWDPSSGRTEKPPKVWPNVELTCEPLVELLRRGNFICTSSLLLRRRAFQEIGLMNEDPQLAPTEDWEYAIRLAVRFRFGRTPGVLTSYRLHDANASRDVPFSRMDALRSALEAGILPERAHRALFLSNYYFKRAEKHLDTPGHPVRRDFLRAIRNDPANLRRWVGLLSLLLPRFAFAALYARLKKTQRRVEKDRAFPHKLAR